MKSKIIKAFNVIAIILNIIVTLMRAIGINGYVADITGDFSYLNKLSISEGQKRTIIENSSPVIGYLNIVLVLLGISIIITLIMQSKSIKMNKKFILPNILIILYGIIESINVLSAKTVDYSGMLGVLLFILLGGIPLVVSLSNKN